MHSPVLALTDRPAAAGARRAALFVVGLSTLLFLALAPVAKRMLGHADWFIPLFQSVLITNDLLTAALLFGQVRLARQCGSLVLACGFVYAAAMATVHLLSFPGVFAPGGLLGAGPQTTGYLHVFWHLGMPIAVILYTFERQRGRRIARPVSRAAAAGLGIVALLVVALTLLATVGSGLLPPMLQGEHYSSAFNIGRYGQWFLTAAAAAVLWRRRVRSVLDLWLLVMLCDSFFEIGLVSIFNSGRYDAGFYAGRVYAVLASCMVLAMLLVEHGKMYGELADAQETARSEAALRESREVLRLAMQGGRMAAWTRDLASGRTWWSPEIEGLTGFPAALLGASAQAFLERVHPDEQRLLREFLDNGFDGAEQEFAFEFRLRHAGGAWDWLHCRGEMLRDEEAQPARLVGVLIDVSERKRLEEDRERLLASERRAREEADRRRAEVERVTESRARLIRGFSHDLRNPLAAADGNAMLLEDGRAFGALNDKQAERVHRIRRGIGTSLRLIEDLLELGRAEAGQIELQQVDIDVSQAAHEIIEDFQAQAAAVGLAIEVRVPPGVTAHADPVRVRQILANLVSNAVKYAPQGRATLHAAPPSSGAPAPGPWTTVSVSDTGPGIPADKRELIFEEYARLDPNAQQGAGIGLAISRRVARLMGGDLTVESQVGKGSTFTLWVPASEPR